MIGKILCWLRFHDVYKEEWLVCCNRPNCTWTYCGMIDLTRVFNCIKEMKQNKTYRGEKIGVLVERIDFIHPKGRVVVFKPEKSYDEWGQEDGGVHSTVTIEIPMSMDAIEEQRKNKSFLTTNGTMICVPVHYVKEIILPGDN